MFKCDTRLSTGLTGQDPDSLAVRRPISIESFEDFSQLCVVVNVVKVLPGTDVLLSAVNVEDGVIRLFRDWLKGQSNRLPDLQPHTSSESQGEVLWVDQNRNVGLKFRVSDVTKLDSNFPVLVHRDDETFSSYEIVIDGTPNCFFTTGPRLTWNIELHIRTTRLLLTVEQSLQEQQSYPKAVIFTSMG